MIKFKRQETTGKVNVTTSIDEVTNTLIEKCATLIGVTKSEALRQLLYEGVKQLSDDGEFGDASEAE